MFTNNPSECFTHDFTSEENLPKWKEMFVPALEKILKQVHPSLTASKESIEKVEVLIIQVLAILLCGAPPPHSINDISDRVHKKLPDPINSWAVNDANAAIDRLKKDRKGGAVNLQMSVEKLHQMLVKEVFLHKIDYQITVFITAVLEYVAADILKLIGNYVKNIRHGVITLPDVDVALCADKVLMNMLFEDDDIVHLPTANEKSLYSLTYEEVVKDLILVENQYLRELNMIIKVFQDSIKGETLSQTMVEIFDSVSDMHELTLNLISSLEDTLEATKEGEAVLIGSCFEEFMEGMEFNAYQRYSFLMLDVNIHVKWVDECSRLDLSHLTRRGLKDCVKYVLPNLLLDPFYHFIYYCDILKMLTSKSKDDEDVELLRQSVNSLNIIRANTDMDRKLASKVYFKKGRRSTEKLEEVQKSIDGWDGKNINQICNDYITEGFLQKISGKRLSDRYVFLFDGIVVLTKKVNPASRRSVAYSSSQNPFDFKLKEKFFVRKIEVIDKEDTEDLKNAFEILSTHQKQTSHMTLFSKSHEDKIHWLSAFYYLLNKSMLERLLDSKLKEEEKRQPLKLPSPDQYRFAIEDSDDNIVFEDNGGGSNTSSNDIPIIKGGIIIKLVERLTYHSYFDPKFTKTFLTTYRTFCKPKELLSLLIERFNIPEPNGSNVERDSMKKFRNSFIKPISFRVLNVLRQWVDHHWHDFESDKALYDQLIQFLEESVKGKVLKKWVETINKVLARKLNSSKVAKQITFVSTPPPIEWHITRNPAEFDIMNLHPIEIARQVTLLEFEIFKTIKSSEMVGAVWTKKDKQITSPNLLKMIHHTTKFTFWLEKCILETDNFEERVAVMSRVLEILVVFQELNNFNGVIEVHSALSSASVHRLEHTFEEVEKKSPKLMKALEESRILNEDHLRRCIEKLRSINPPCIPFLGMYLTHILHLEEGNPDFLTNRPQGFINFSKRRKVAEITAEIQQYQDQPYCLNPELQIRAFIENLKPFSDKTDKEFDDYLYERSLFVEPRNGKPIKMEKKRDYSLKSPGTKPSSTLSSSSLPSRGNIALLASHRNHHHFHHHRSSQASSVITQGTSLDESLEENSPTDSGSPISYSTHYSSGEDVGESKDMLDDQSISSSNFHQSFASLQMKGLSGSTRTLCSSNTLVHSPQPAQRSPASPMDLPPSSSSSPPPLPPRHATRMRRHNHSHSPSLLHSGNNNNNNNVTRFPFPPRKGILEELPPALPPRENPPSGRLPPPVPPRRSEHIAPQFQHHPNSPLSVDATNFYAEFTSRTPPTPASINGCRDSALSSDEPEEQVPAIPPKNYRGYSGVS